MAIVPRLPALANAIAIVALSPTKSNTAVAPSPPVSSRTRAAVLSSDSNASCAPSSRARSSRCCTRSTAITRAPVSRRRYCTAYDPSPPAPITTAVEPGISFGSARFTAWYDVAPASVSGPTRRGSSVVKRHQLAPRDHEVLREPAVLAVAAAARAARAVVVVAAEAVPAAAARVDAGDGDGLAELEVLDVGSRASPPSPALSCPSVNGSSHGITPGGVSRNMKSLWQRPTPATLMSTSSGAGCRHVDLAELGRLAPLDDWYAVIVLMAATLRGAASACTGSASTRACRRARARRRTSTATRSPRR